MAATGVRIGWWDLPGRVRAAVEEIVGDPVVEAVPQSGGFSPGSADRLRTQGGLRAFAKAVSPAQNPHSPTMLRREAVVTAALPPWAPAPRMLGLHDDGEWVALVCEDIDGRHPATPWRAAEIRATLRALDTLAAGPAPPVPDLQPAADLLGEDLAGWHRIAARPPPDLHPLARRHLDRLRALADRAGDALDGGSLAHCDIRADNLLIGADGTVTVVDWPWACRGPAWLDPLMLLLNVRLHGGHDTTALLAGVVAATGARPAAPVAVLAALAGFFADAARRPPPPGLPTVRAFQRAQAHAALGWLAELPAAGLDRA